MQKCKISCSIEIIKDYFAKKLILAITFHNGGFMKKLVGVFAFFFLASNALFAQRTVHDIKGKYYSIAGRHACPTTLYCTGKVDNGDGESIFCYNQFGNENIDVEINLSQINKGEYEKVIAGAKSKVNVVGEYHDMKITITENGQKYLDENNRIPVPFMKFNKKTEVFVLDDQTIGFIIADDQKGIEKLSCGYSSRIE